MAHPQSALLSIPQLCREFSVSRSHVYEQLRDGRLKAVKIGRYTRIQREEAVQWANKAKEFKPWLPRKLRPRPA